MKTQNSLNEQPRCKQTRYQFSRNLVLSQQAAGNINPHCGIKVIAKAILFILITFSTSIHAQKSISEWSFKTGGNVNSTVSISDGLIYIGSYDSIFYAIDTLGNEQWKFNAHFSIQSNALVFESVVCFQSGNRLIGLNKATGDLLWKHEPAEVLEQEPIVLTDPFDLKDASPVLSDSIAYYGNEYGKFYGVNLLTGQQAFEYNTGNGHPITTTAAIVNDTAYFGDMEGFVYAVNLSDTSKVWKMRTYDGNKPYDFFGPVIGTLVVENNYLYFGLQNDKFQVLNRITGEEALSISDGGSWITGIPLFENGIMYIGSSDSKKLHAYNAETGENLWSVPVGCGVYNGTALYNDYVVVLAGYEKWESFRDATNSQGSGSGRLMVIDKNGNVVNAISLSGSVFSSPVISNNKLYFGSMNDYIHCIDMEAITTNAEAVLLFDDSDMKLDAIESNGNIKVNLPLVYSTGTKFTDLEFAVTNSSLPDDSYAISGSTHVNALDSVSPRITIKSSLLENQEYSLTFQVSEVGAAEVLYEKNISFLRNVVSINDKDHGSLNVYPNPFKDEIRIDIPENVNEGTITFFDVQGKKLKSQIVSRNYNTVNLSDIAKGRNVIIYTMNGINNSYYSGILKRD